MGAKIYAALPTFSSVLAAMAQEVSLNAAIGAKVIAAFPVCCAFKCHRYIHLQPASTQSHLSNFHVSETLLVQSTSAPASIFVR